MRVHAALDMSVSQSHATCCNQHADSTLQATDIAQRVGLSASHGQTQIVGTRRRGVVPLVGKILPVERAHHGRVVPLLGGLGQKFRHIGRRGVLQQCVVALQGLEFLQVRARNSELLRIDHSNRTVVAHQCRECLGFWGVEQQMVATHVNAVGRGTGACLGPVRVGAWNDDDVDILQQGLQQPLGKFAGNNQQRFAACGLITMLLGDQKHGRQLGGV